MVIWRAWIVFHVNKTDGVGDDNVNEEEDGGADASAAVARPLKLLQAETEGTVDSLERPLGGGGGGGGGCLSSVSKVFRHGMSTRGSPTPKKT